MGYLKERELEGYRPIRIERAYHLTQPVAVVAFDRALEAFAASISPQWARKAKQLIVDPRWRSAIRRAWSVTNAEGTFACESLEHLREHLGRRRVDRFTIKLDFRVRQACARRSQHWQPCGRDIRSVDARNCPSGV
jgi:hypothetical protein